MPAQTAVQRDRVKFHFASNTTLRQDTSVHILLKVTYVKDVSEVYTTVVFDFTCLYYL